MQLLGQLLNLINKRIKGYVFEIARSLDNFTQIRHFLACSFQYRYFDYDKTWMWHFKTLDFKTSRLFTLEAVRGVVKLYMAAHIYTERPIRAHLINILQLI